MNTTSNQFDDAPPPALVRCSNCHRPLNLHPALANYDVLCVECCNKILTQMLDPEHYRDAH